MLSNAQIFYFLLLLNGLSGAQKETCFETYNCGLESPCYIGYSCICPAGYVRTTESNDSGFICYPEKACSGPNEKWKKVHYIYFGCVQTNNSVQRIDAQEYEIHEVDNAAYILVLFLVLVFLISKWAMAKDKAASSSTN